MSPRDPYADPSGVLRNRLGITDPDRLAKAERALAYQRAAELEIHPIAGSFDFPHLQAIHHHLLQDVYDWAGQLRTSDTTALGIPHCRPAFLHQELDRVFAQIAAEPLSTTDRDAAVDTVARHWGELTLVHPFRDGNSRSQRVFFDQMLREAGWGIDWTAVDAAATHAARHMAFWRRYDYLADQLRPATGPLGYEPAGTLAAPQGNRDATSAATCYREMLDHHRRGDRTPFVGSSGFRVR